VGTAITAWRNGARGYLVACLIARLLKSALRGGRGALGAEALSSLHTA
jgi:hypothetical protein